MPRLWAATGDAVVRIDDVGPEWVVTRVLDAAGAQCVAADPADADVVYVGLREGGVRRTRDGGSAWEDCGLPEPGVFSLAVSAADGAVYAGTEPSRLFQSTTAVTRGMRWTRCSTCHRGPAGVSPRGRGRRTSVGSLQVRTMPTCCSSASSWAV